MSDKAYVRESIEKAVQEKDAVFLGKIVFAIESAVEEDIFEGPMGVVYDVQDKIGDAKTCQEILELIAKHELTPPKAAGICSFGDFLDNDFIGDPETDTVIFYKAVTEFLFNHPNESRISPENKSWVADELLFFVEANVYDDAFEEIADMLDE